MRKRAAFIIALLRYASTTARALTMAAMDGVVPWRERIVGSIAKSRKIRGGNYVQLASVTADGLPKARGRAVL